MCIWVSDRLSDSRRSASPDSGAWPWNGATPAGGTGLRAPWCAGSGAEAPGSPTSAAMSSDNCDGRSVASGGTPAQHESVLSPLSPLKGTDNAEEGGSVASAHGSGSRSYTLSIDVYHHREVHIHHNMYCASASGIQQASTITQSNNRHKLWPGVP